METYPIVSGKARFAVSRSISIVNVKITSASRSGSNVFARMATYPPTRHESLNIRGLMASLNSFVDALGASRPTS
jgi:hypothetical protein